MIIPAILETDFKALAAKVLALPAEAEWVQIDIGDGRFAPITTRFTPADLAQLPGRFKLELHLMVEHPEDILPDWLAVGDRFLIHPESTEHLAEIITTLKELPVPLEIGLALLIDTPLAVVAPYLPQVPVIQLMGIAEIGRQGIPFDQRVIERVRELRKMAPDVTIQIDGGVSAENEHELRAAGADDLVVGHNYESLRRES